MTRSEAKQKYVEYIMQHGNPAYFIYRWLKDVKNEELAELIRQTCGDEVEVEDDV